MSYAKNAGECTPDLRYYYCFNCGIGQLHAMKLDLASNARWGVCQNCGAGRQCTGDKRY